MYKPSNPIPWCTRKIDFFFFVVVVVVGIGKNNFIERRLFIENRHEVAQRIIIGKISTNESLYEGINTVTISETRNKRPFIKRTNEGCLNLS